MDFISLFSGIEGFGLGLERSGMRCVAQVEKDAACRSVLARHFPTVPRFDDVREFHARSIAVRPDLICGGFPCQDLSVAGRRAGLAGKRSGLFHEFMRIVGEFSPAFVLIENVPGLLSSNQGRDMGVVVGRLADLGYGWAYRVLDAQWFGLAQRRKRVFVVGCLGKVRRAAEILFERESLPWDSPPSREARARVAARLTSGTATGSGVNKPGRRREDDFNLAYCLDAHHGRNNHEANYVQEVAAPITRSFAKHHGSSAGKDSYPHNLVAANNTGAGFWTEAEQAGCLRVSAAPTQPQTIVTHTLRAEGHDASEDGTGRGVPLVIEQNTQCSTPSLPSLRACETPNYAVAFTDLRGRNNEAVYGDMAGTLHAAKGKSEVQAVAYRTAGNCGPFEQGDKTGALNTATDPSQNIVKLSSGVRRLTPRECERLQGFPDDWTRYAADDKELSDSARYRMLGNAVAVPVAAWLGRRIMEN